uniref:Permease n=1 Tax=Acrobeloides nanus TaxID=290746 RepID=A0A914CXH7_9BILA
MDLTDFQSEYFWAILVGFILAFIIGVGLGANGIENSFGPAINSGAIGYVKAYILASIFTIIGATLVGKHV